jgi:hypothetical protein
MSTTTAKVQPHRLAAQPLGGAMLNTYGSRKVGDVTALGTIERVSLTAYFIGGAWHSFVKVDGLTAAEPLVIFG